MNAISTNEVFKADERGILTTLRRCPSDGGYTLYQNDRHDRCSVFFRLEDVAPICRFIEGSETRAVIESKDGTMVWSKYSSDDSINILQEDEFGDKQQIWLAPDWWTDIYTRILPE